MRFVTSVLSVFLALSATTASAADVCKAKALEGRWKNIFGVQFEFLSNGCDTVSIRDLGLDGKRPADTYVLSLSRAGDTDLGRGLSARSTPVTSTRFSRLYGSGQVLIGSPSKKAGFGRIGLSVQAFAYYRSPGDAQVSSIDLWPGDFVYVSGGAPAFDQGARFVVSALNYFGVVNYVRKDFYEQNRLLRIR